MERGKAPALALEQVALGPLLDELEREARDRVEAADGEFRYGAADVPREGHIDAEALRRAVLNLVDNAVKHGGGRVEVAIASNGRGQLAIRVRDHGPGVAARDRDAIFEPFRRLDDSAEAPAGVGLGLAIVAEIARGHGGEVRVTAPEAGSGTVVELVIPIEEVA